MFSDEELHPNEAQRRKKESLGTHLWLWVQRRACRGFSLQSDLRMHGRIAPPYLHRLSEPKRRAREGDEQQQQQQRQR